MSGNKRLTDRMRMAVIGKGDGLAFVIGIVVGIVCAAASFWLVG